MRTQLCAIRSLFCSFAQKGLGSVAACAIRVPFCSRCTVPESGAVSITLMNCGNAFPLLRRARPFAGSGVEYYRTEAELRKKRRNRSAFMPEYRTAPELRKGERRLRRRRAESQPHSRRNTEPSPNCARTAYRGHRCWTGPFGRRSGKDHRTLVRMRSAESETNRNAFGSTRKSGTGYSVMQTCGFFHV